MGVLNSALRTAACGQAGSHIPALGFIMVLACTLSLLQFGCGGNANGNGGGGGGGGTQEEFVGSWLGPVPGDAGLCGAAVGTWTFSSNGTYAFNAQFDSTNCADYLLTGTYSLQGSTIDFSQLHDQTCPLCPQTAQYSATYSFLTANSLQLCDPQCYLYNRQ